MMVSATAKAVLLQYRHRIVSKGYAVIFMNEELARDGLKPLVYTNAAARAEMAKKLFQDCFGFVVEICVNFTKKQIIDKLKELQAISDQFDPA